MRVNVELERLSTNGRHLLSEAAWRRLNLALNQLRLTAQQAQ